MISTSSISSAIIPIIGVIIGSVLTGAITYINNHKQRKHSDLVEQKKLDINRIEECYELLDKLNEYTCKLVIAMAASVSDRVPMSPDGIERISTDRLELLSNLYFDDLKTDSKRIKANFTELTGIIARYCIADNMNENDAKQSLKDAHEVSQKIHQSIKSMKSKLVSKSNEINTVA
ncbi:hypothetical protein THF5G08_370004 [Vibrio jasicida]|nr:hypothetical protein THF5G08_370004 [Vibrio jasicida]HDU8572134.1 hypothetical protein [Vibrio parahaemolyticus]